MSQETKKTAIEEGSDAIVMKIKELIDRGFTGSITTTYHLLDGNLMGIEYSIQEKLSTFIPLHLQKKGA